MSARAVIFGCLGLRLSADEKQFFAAADPWGFILFARNIESPEQVRALTSELRDTVGRDAPILIDQEGGRVARLTPPHWTEWDDALPFAAGYFDQVARLEAMRLRYRVIAAELHDLGIDVNCAPMADIAQSDTHPVVRTRCYGTEATDVALLGRAVADGLLAGGVLPVLKHIPGHGRTPVDSHQGLPVVEADQALLEEADFAPFKALSDLPLGMTAHVVYSAFDPDNCATLSRRVLDSVRSDIGFDGLLMTDDLSMGALTGSFESRVSRATAAGCDMILHCNGDMAEMTEIAAATQRLDGKAHRRADTALAQRRQPDAFDRADALARIDALRKEPANA